MALTRGQDSLIIDLDHMGTTVNAIDIKHDRGAALKVLMASEDEVSMHEEYLQKLGDVVKSRW